jgi:hypothetical protein
MPDGLVPGERRYRLRPAATNGPLPIDGNRTLLALLPKRFADPRQPRSRHREVPGQTLRLSLFP